MNRRCILLMFDVTAMPTGAICLRRILKNAIFERPATVSHEWIDDCARLWHRNLCLFLSVVHQLKLFFTRLSFLKFLLTLKHCQSNEIDVVNLHCSMKWETFFKLNTATSSQNQSVILLLNTLAHRQISNIKHTNEKIHIHDETSDLAVGIYMLFVVWITLSMCESVQCRRRLALLCVLKTYRIICSIERLANNCSQ